MGLTEKQKGIGLMFLSVVLLSAMQAVVALSADRIGVMQQVFCRNGISLIVAFVLIRKKKLSMFGERKYQPFLFARSFFGFIGVWLLFYASRNAEQADVSILSRLSPFLITILAAVFLKQKNSKMQWPALILAFAGAYIAAAPSFSSDWLPLASSLGAAVASAIAYTLLGYFKGKVNALTVIMHLSTFSMAAAIPLMWKDFVWPDRREALMLLLIGLFGSFGQICLTYSYRMAPAAEVSIYSQFGIVVSILLGYVLLGQVPKGSSVLGGALVILASALVYWYNNRKLDAHEAGEADAWVE